MQTRPVGRCYSDIVAAWPEFDRLALRGRLEARSVIDSAPNLITGTQCRVWCGATQTDGYGIYRAHQERFRAHRLMLVAHGVYDRPDLVVNHLCRNRACVEVSHLELVTQRVNILTGTSPSAINAAKPACDRGHLFDATNTSVRRCGQRRCLSCHRYLMRRYRAIARAAA